MRAMLSLKLCLARDAGKLAAGQWVVGNGAKVDLAFSHRPKKLFERKIGAKKKSLKRLRSLVERIRRRLKHESLM